MIDKLTAPWRAWVALCTATEPGTALALFRIAIALVVSVDAASLLVADVLDPLYMPIAEGGLAPATRFPSLLLDLVGHTRQSTVALCWSMLGLGLVSLLGLGGRLTQFLLLQVVLAWHAIPLDIGGGYDRLLTNALFLLVLGNSTATLSADCRLREGKWTSERDVLALARTLGVIQLAVVYTITGIEKSGGGWHPPYDAVFRALQLDSWARWPDMVWLGYAWVPAQIGTVVALWWERSFFLILPWFAAHAGVFGERARALATRVDLRWPYLGIGLVMHAVLGLFTNLGTFTTVTLCFYVLLLAPGEWARVRERLAQRLAARGVDSAA